MMNMRKLAGGLLVVGALVAVLQVSAFGAVQIAWTDAGGNKVVQLQLVPIAVADPLYAGFDYAWFGTLDVEMATAPIDFVGTGNFIGQFNEPWFQVILYQDVHNLTDCTWSEFNLDLVGAFFGAVDGAVNNWSVNQTSFNILYYADPGPFVSPGGVFHDGITVFDPQSSPTASFVITKYPTCIPEPGGCAVLMGGLAGLITFIRRRKA
ncbi:MAG: hypothetical protein A2Z18_06990 [Armatimonadetes bacterium RBG_16_58_9]|nr:MAG: hypothetical protein A2Z18_06990 [Armatimonadetes bacterium RBG_16_58_9]